MKPTNVRPGDRAIIVASGLPENVGIVVDVIREYAGERTFSTGGVYRFEPSAVAWVVESLGRPIVKVGVRSGNSYHEPVSVVADNCLRPLRDNDQEDEMVSRVGRAPQPALAKPRDLQRAILERLFPKETSHD